MTNAGRRDRLASPQAGAPRAPLEHLRPPLTRLRRSDWVWRAPRRFDGVLIPLAGGDAAARRAALAPFLDQATSLLESEAALLALFSAPVPLEPEALGPALGLVRIAGALAAFPVAAPEDPALGAWLRGRVLWMEGGAPRAAPLAAFRPMDLAAWISVEGAAPERAAAPPLLPNAAPARLEVTAEALTEARFAQSGLEGVRARLAARRSGGWFARVFGGGRGRPTAERRRSERAPGGAEAASVSSAGPDRVSRAAALVLAAIGLGAIAFALWTDGSGADWAFGPLLALSVLGAALGALIGAALVALSPCQGDARRRAAARKPGAGPAPRAPASRGKPAGDRRGFVVGAITAAALFVGLAAAAPHIAVVLLMMLAIIGVGHLFVAMLGAVGALLRRGASGGADGTARSARGGSAPGAPGAGPTGGGFPRWLERLLGRTPLRDRALGQYRRRVEEIERLFAQGRIDDALKKALAVDERPPLEDAPRADQPAFGPGVRERIEIAARRPAAGRALAALPPGARQALSQLYRAQARELLKAGEVEKAAFIYAELLDEPGAAVHAFAEAGRYATAAELSQGRGMDPAQFIPLWYRAGERDRALRLADRHGAYALLLNSTNHKDASFKAEIRRIWSARLAAVGAHGRALSVSEPLLAEDPTAAAPRLAWMREALAAPQLDPVAAARALKALPPDGGAAEGRDGAPADQAMA
ncbi:MAG: hypothetical protein AAGM38_04560, partial [Pseudomonadota bacterium]